MGKECDAHKYLIVNADDFGASVGLNRGILEAHTRGVVTSTSLMVTGSAAREAVAMSRDCPGLSVGLHWDVSGEGESSFDVTDLHAVHSEFRRQLDEFQRLVGRLPTHIDSHHHVHRRAALTPVFKELVEPLQVPLRGAECIRFVGGFYAQWQRMVTNLEYVSVPALQRMLRDEVKPGWTEFSCHPGYASPDFTSEYLHEREAELRTLTAPAIQETIETLGIHLVSYVAYQAHRASGSTRAPH
jgi:predicted glycoside hydrolase/deacetylase ChbG (UPF0249 family)